MGNQDKVSEVEISYHLDWGEIVGGTCRLKIYWWFAIMDKMLTDYQYKKSWWVK